LDADGQADEVRRLKKEAGKLQLKLGISEQARERLENHLDKNNSLFKANIRELDAARTLAEEATKLKDKFISLVAHDLRSPFASMLGLIRIYAEGKPSAEGEESQKILDRVFKSGERMIAMIDNLLKISRLQTGQITPDPWFFKGYMAAANTIGSLSHNAAQKGIVIINKVPVDMRLYADQTLFDEVLLNLLSNAIKFCSRGDTITFFVPPALFSAIAVRDTGKGISEKITPNLFKHEMATTTPGTAGETGTGLGLPFSHDIMKAHGGELTVESVPGTGSVFCAILPYVKPVALVVDDDPMSMLVVRSHLEKIDIEVMEAVNGEKALSAMKDKRPHIIITDINMPGMDGYTLLARLKQDNAIKEIPVIVMTSADGETREKAFRYGASDFVDKPVILDEFIPRVRRYVG
jgi:signal transduction histidine kinase